MKDLKAAHFLSRKSESADRLDEDIPYKKFSTDLSTGNGEG
jgi:hypothetical protein